MLRSQYPNYHISKNKIELSPDLNVDKVLIGIKDKYKKYIVDTRDGIKLEFDKDWIHLRRSNTEPIIRIIAEGASRTTADNLAHKLMQDISEVMKNR